MFRIGVGVYSYGCMAVVERVWDRRERAKLEATLTALSIKTSRAKEAEVKFRSSLRNHQRIEKKLSDSGAKLVFSGKVNTWLFEGPQKGVSIRIKEAVSDDPELPTEFSWAIKLDSHSGLPDRPLKNKDEIEPELPLATFSDAKKQLNAVLQLLGMPMQLEKHQLLVGKRRRSFIVPKNADEKRKRRYRRLRVDLDVFSSVDREPIMPKYVAEAEDTSDLSEAVKMRRIKELAKMIDHTIDPKYANLSARGVLIAEGVIETHYMIVDAARLRREKGTA